MLYRPTLAAILACAALLGAGTTQAQSARSLALAGTTIPGLEAVSANPAALARPERTQGLEFALPLGALNYLLTEWADPLGPEADYLALATQLEQLEALLILVARAPEALTLRVDAHGITLEGDGRALTLPDRYAFAQGYELPLRVRVAPALELGVRPYVNVGLAGNVMLDVDAAEDEPSVSARVELGGSAQADAGVAIEVAYGFVLPQPDDVQVRDLYLGARAHALVGLAFAAADGSGTLALAIDGEGAGEDPLLDYEADVYLGGLLAGGVGVGAAVDVGFMAVLDTTYGPVDVSFLVERLGATWWSVERTTFSGDASDSEPTSERVVRATPFDVSLAAGLRITQATMDALGLDAVIRQGIDPAVAMNVGYGLGTGARASLATEIGIDAFSVRAGVGYDAGWRVGSGVGYDVGPVGFDVAISAQQAPFTGTFTLGVAASLRVATGR